jgi:hypothetical protein
MWQPSSTYYYVAPMTDHPIAALPPRGKDPFSASVLNNWIQQAATKSDIAPKRVARTVANGLVIAALQRVKHDDGDPVFAIKGGASLEVRLGLRARMSGDLDAVFRAEFDRFLDTLDEALATGIGAFDFERGEAEEIPVKGRRVKPIRVAIRIMIKGKPALRVDLEVGPTEAGSGDRVDMISYPSLEHFTTSTPTDIAVMAVEYQIAQKLHACTDPDTEERPNLRVHDTVDLVLLRETFFASGATPSLRAACHAVFAARAAEAMATGEIEPRAWPPTLIAHPHWTEPFSRLAAECALEDDLVAAVASINNWIAEIAETEMPT